MSHSPLPHDTDSPGRVASALRGISRIPEALLIGLVRGYQLLLRPFFGNRCRFQPTCSNYFIGAVRKYGPVLGTIRGVWRILRCHPWNPGGYDPP